MSSKVGIIILNYNGWKDTLGCVESIQKLDYPNFETVVVDNASKDDSWKRLEEQKERLRFFLIQSGANLGYAGGNNAGIAWALERKADYIWILNNDTIVDKDCLKFLVGYAEKNPKAGIVGASIYYYDTKEKLQAWGGGHINAWMGTSRNASSPETSASKLDYISGACILARASMIREIGSLDSRFFIYWEDTDWCYRANKAEWSLAVAEGARVWHKEGAAIGKRSPLADFHHTKSGVMFFLRHYPHHLGIPIVVMLLGKTMKRLLRLDWTRIPLIWRAGFAGIRDYSSTPVPKIQMGLSSTTESKN